MADEPDAAEQVQAGFNRTLGTMLGLSAPIMVMAVRLLLERARMRVAQDQAQRDVIRAALERERATALARVRPLRELEGWTNVTDRELVQAWRLAVAWREVDALELAPTQPAELVEQGHGEFDELVERMRIGFQEQRQVEADPRVVDGEVLLSEVVELLPSWDPPMGGSHEEFDQEVRNAIARIDDQSALAGAPPPAERLDPEAAEAATVAARFQRFPAVGAVTQAPAAAATTAQDGLPQQARRALEAAAPGR